MDRLLLVLGGFSIVLLVLVLSSVRREHIRVEYSVSWLDRCDASDARLVQPDAFCHGWRGMMGIDVSATGRYRVHVRRISGGACIAFRFGFPS